ncbi:methyltransferase domain-containing protein [Falsiroseomonas sp. CW058]|uniref:methyltransferase domain-containing protein n=1 Tax=Falsiroseomonas sp. CW058 TaxID=3388664 RepID=UPI003D323B7C
MNHTATTQPAARHSTQRAPCCRCCGAALSETFADLGLTPLANSYVAPERASAMEPFYPLHALVCSDCRLVQLAEFETPQAIFGDYLYFSSYSASWLRHAEDYARMMTARFGLGPSTQVVEVASNDGYLLQYFAREGIPVMGIDPAANVAEVAVGRGIPTDVAFFGAATARRLRAAGHAPALMCANNVMAHVPDLHDFVEGFRILLAPGGVLTVEFPHLLRLMAENQFDTIYHEHFSYFSLMTAEMVMAQHGLVVFDVQELPTHGGSLRIFVRHAEDATKPVTEAVEALRAREKAAGLDGPDAYRAFAAQVVETKCALLDFLVGAHRAGQRVVAYGAPAKGNTLLNYCGIGPEFLPFTVDASPHKQGLLLPGTRIPIRAPEAILQEKPDFVLILPWNLRQEISQQMQAIREWGGRFVVPIPSVQVF